MPDHFHYRVMEHLKRHQSAIRQWSGKHLRDIIYGFWIQRFDTLNTRDRAILANEIFDLPHTPMISVIMPAYNTPPQLLRRAIESVQGQIYPFWELCIADDYSSIDLVRTTVEDYGRNDDRIKFRRRTSRGHIAHASNTALELATGQYCTFLDHDDELSEQALYWIAKEINAHPDADIIYSDEDKIDINGHRFDPHVKPGWNSDLFLSCNYLSHLSAYRTNRILEAGGFRAGMEGAQDYDLALRILESPNFSGVRHIPRILYHWRAVPGSTAQGTQEKQYASHAARRAVSEHLQRRGIAAEVATAHLPQYQRIRYQPKRPSVSIIIRPGGGDVGRCMKGILRSVDCESLEIIVICGPEELKAIADISDHRITALPHTPAQPAAAIHFSAISSSRGNILLLMDSSCEALSLEWISEIAANAYRDDTDIVCAKLLADPAMQNRPGYFGRDLLQQNISVADARFMAMPRQVFLEATEGMDAQDWDVSVFCQTLRVKRYRVTWTPFAQMLLRDPHPIRDLSRPALDAAISEEPFHQNPNLTPWGSFNLLPPATPGYFRKKLSANRVNQRVNPFRGAPDPAEP